MKSETLIYGYELLMILDELPDISFKELEKEAKIKGDELRGLLKYLKQKGYITWRLPLFVGTLKSTTIIDTDKINLTHNGMEVVLGTREYYGDTKNISQTIENQTNVQGSSEVQIAQSVGDNSQITQTTNIQVESLKEELEKELSKKKPSESKVRNIIDNIIKVAKKGASEIISTVFLKSIGL